jgi:hypothetical protein
MRGSFALGVLDSHDGSERVVLTSTRFHDPHPVSRDEGLDSPDTTFRSSTPLAARPDEEGATGTGHVSEMLGPQVRHRKDHSSECHLA